MYTIDRSIKLIINHVLINKSNVIAMFSRQKLLLQQQQYASESANHVKGGFGGLARTVSERWRKLDLAYKMKLDNLVDMDKIRHARETKAWNTAKALQVTYIKKSGEDEVTAKIHEIAQEEATAPTSAPVITDWDSHSTASKASSFKDDFEPLPFDAPVKESLFQFNESTWNSLSDILHAIRAHAESHVRLTQERPTLLPQARGRLEG